VRARKTGAGHILHIVFSQGPRAWAGSGSKPGFPSRWPQERTTARIVFAQAFGQAGCDAGGCLDAAVVAVNLLFLWTPSVQGVVERPSDPCGQAISSGSGPASPAPSERFIDTRCCGKIERSQMWMNFHCASFHHLPQGGRVGQ